VITVDDIVEVIDEEAHEDLMRLVGAGHVSLADAIWDTTKARFSWLSVNLVTAILASAVIALFEDTLDALVALAVLMPIVASMGGNAGTQALAVVVRALAMKEIDARDGRNLLLKESVIGLINGLAFALIAGGLSWAWTGDATIGIIMGVAMIVNLLVAGVSGAGVPMLLNRLGVDPAVASTVLLTTITDVAGFMTFLGLAALVLL